MPQEDLKAKARDSLKEFISQNLQEDLSKLTSKQRSWAMIRWYIDRIHICLQPPISDDDLELSHVDNPDDLGADFLYRDEELSEILHLDRQRCTFF